MLMTVLTIILKIIFSGLSSKIYFRRTDLEISSIHRQVIEYPQGCGLHLKMTIFQTQ